MPWASKREKRKRKDEWLEATTEVESINTFMLSWEFELPKIELNIGFNVLFNLLLDFQLSLDWHFPLIDIQPLWQTPKARYAPPLAIYGKSRYDKSCYAQPDVDYSCYQYGRSVYDPPELTYEQIKNFLWDLRYKTTDRDRPTWKRTDRAAKEMIEWLKNIIIKKGLSERAAQGLAESLLYIEGRLYSGSYAGFAVVGIARVMPRKMKGSQEYTLAEMRSYEDFKTPWGFRTTGIYESHVGRAMVGYSRVSMNYFKVKEKLLRDMLKSMSAILNERNVGFKQRSTLTPIKVAPEYPVSPEVAEVTKYIKYTKVRGTTLFPSTIWQRTFFYTKREQMKWGGAKHQARLEDIISRVKEILDASGIPGFVRAGYIGFAQEFLYKDYKGHVKWKQWKQLMADDEIIEKWARQGLDRKILENIASVIKGWRAAL